jgi:hypothetical protein
MTYSSESAMDASPSAPSRVEPRRVVLVAIAAFGCGVGSSPYLLFVDRLVYLWGLVPLAVAAASLALRGLKTEATAHPSLGEWLLGTWAAVAKPALGSLGGLLLYAIFYWGLTGYVGTARYLGFAPGGDASAWGFWGSIWVLGGATVAGSTEGMRELARQLYPRDAWARSAFYSLLTRAGWIAAAAAAAVVTVGAMFWLFDLRGVALPAALAALFFYTSFPLAELGEQGHDKLRSMVVDALAAVLEAAGYRIVRTPRTGKPEIDPLLKSLDLLARRDDRAFAVEVKSVAGSRVPVEWNEATAVRTAATLLSSEIVSDFGAPVNVEPLLMLVGGSIAQSLRAFSQRERVPIVHFDHLAEAVSDRGLMSQRLAEAGVPLSNPQTASSAVA